MSREITLPTGKREALRTDPRLLVIYSRPKAGKTTLLSHLPNNMVLDLEGGTEYLDSLSMNIIGLSPPADESDEAFKYRMSTKDNKGKDKVPEYYLMEAGKAIMMAGRPYDFITLDTVSILEDYALNLALNRYKASPIGKNFEGDDILTLSKGAGYQWVRTATTDLIDKVRKLADNIIVVAHTKTSIIEKAGKEVDAKDIDLIGKSKQILTSAADAVGYLYRGNKGEVFLSFKGDDTITCGSRCNHLKDSIIKMADYDEESKLLTNVNWKAIYPDTLK